MDNLKVFEALNKLLQRDPVSRRIRIAQGEITEGAIVGKEALITARLLSSQSGMTDVTTLYLDLKKHDPNNLEVINPGVQLGMF